MRAVLMIALAMALVGLPTVSAQETPPLEYSTIVDPVSFTFDASSFQTDSDGNRIKDENGAFVPVRQFVTLTVEASMTCPTEPDGHVFGVFATGPRVTKEEGGVVYSMQDLSPRDVTVPWTQATPGGEWTASQSFEIEVVSQTRPTKTLEGTYAWRIDQDTTTINPECIFDSVQENAPEHIVIIPGDDFEATPTGEGNGGTDGGKDTPAPGAVGLIGLVGLAVALRRRS